MRLWHDDVRPPPEKGWEWARTNDAAIELLMTGAVEEISMDHDLGLHTLDAPDEMDMEYWDKVIEITHALNPSTAETGVDLVDWMIEHNRVPAKITIHSWNPDGAMRMALRLADHDHEVIVAPFRPPST